MLVAMETAVMRIPRYWSIHVARATTNVDSISQLIWNIHKLNKYLKQKINYYYNMFFFILHKSQNFHTKQLNCMIMKEIGRVKIYFHVFPFLVFPFLVWKYTFLSCFKNNNMQAKNLMGKCHFLGKVNFPKTHKLFLDLDQIKTQFKTHIPYTQMKSGENTNSWARTWRPHHFPWGCLA